VSALTSSPFQAYLATPEGDPSDLSLPELDLTSPIDVRQIALAGDRPTEAKLSMNWRADITSGSLITGSGPGVIPARDHSPEHKKGAAPANTVHPYSQGERIRHISALTALLHKMRPRDPFPGTGRQRFKVMIAVYSLFKELFEVTHKSAMTDVYASVSQTSSSNPGQGVN
jgi:hypothetical protein